MKLSLVIPAYNEAENLPVLLSRIKEITNSNPDIEVMVVDNGSTDKTTEILSNSSVDIKSVRIEKNIGYGNGILIGLSYATGDVLAWTHADLQTDLDDVLKAYNTYKQNKNDRIFIKGRRKNRSFVENVFTVGMQFVSFIFLGKWLSDINAQPKLFPRDFYNFYLAHGAPLDFSLDLYALYIARANNYKVITVPVYFKKRIAGEAKGGGGSLKNRMKLIKRTFKYIFELHDILKQCK
jgi:glycosyltransferase involved in cell wall biosynthesis